jgi:hypothetical protein
MSRNRERIKRALVTIVTPNHEEKRVFAQEVLPIEPQVSGGPSVEFPLDASTLALWRQSECVAVGDHIDAGRGPSSCPAEVCRRGY